MVTADEIMDNKLIWSCLKSEHNIGLDGKDLLVISIDVTLFLTCDILK